MQIGILADTHDRLPTMQAALEEFRRRGITTVLHPGDIVAPFAAKLLAAWGGTLHVIYGNNDGERRGLRQVLPQIQDGPLRLQLGGRHILLHHALEWCRPEDIAAADIIITGHTHEPIVARREGRLFANPGECCGWVTGRATVAVIELDTCEATLIEVPT